MISLESWLQSPLAAAIGWSLFHSFWQGALVAAVLAATLAIAHSARVRYLAACPALGAIVVCFAATLAWFGPRRHSPGIVQNPAALLWNSDLPPADSSPAPLRRVADFLPWLVPFWIAGVAAFCLRHLVSWILVRRLRRVGVCAASGYWQRQLNSFAGRLRIWRPVALLESCIARVPVVIGHVRPVILMPLGLLAGLPAAQIESILLHELAHIRRYDYLVNMLQTSVESLLFYHPVVWWISGLIRTEREHCCDDVAVALTGDARQYATALASLEQFRSDAAAAALAATGGNIVKRIRRLLAPAYRPASALSPIVPAAILILAAAIGLTAWQKKAPDASDLAATVSPYAKWLNEDVVYIITREERAAFLRLESDPERERFIEQFWLRRDPTPGTPENEFKEEHYRRIAQANLRFPTATGTPGWKTDRGRIYITFGPPDEIDDHSSPGSYNRAGDTGPHTVPYIDWTYRFIDGVGNNVKIEFFDPAGTHEFRMTSDPDPNAPAVRYVAPNR